MSALAVYKDKRTGDVVPEDLMISEVKTKRKRRKSLQESGTGKLKKTKYSSKKCSPLLGEDTKLLNLADMSSSQMSVEKSREDASATGVPFINLFDPCLYDDSLEAGRVLFEMLIEPCPVNVFFRDIWENKPVLLRRSCAEYNNGWFSSQTLNDILQENSLQYSININIASYENGKRMTLNPIGRAYVSSVWDFYQQGCSIQLLNPQTFSKEVWLLCSTLQELFGSFVGANVYLTPPCTQGFAPHYDDIEAFVMQLEGKKRWKLYKPRNRYEILPRISSENFDQSQLGECILDVVLEPGDLLYFPRGTIHQANALSDVHSLHITLSTYQKNTWGDLLEKLIPAALQTAIREDEDFRKSLPRDYLDYMGIIHSKEDCQKRIDFIEKVSELMLRIVTHASSDSATDQMGLEFIHSALPPVISEKESTLGVWRYDKKLNKMGKINQDGTPFITLDSQVKLIRRRILRVVESEENGLILYYTTNNSRAYHEKDIEGMEIGPLDAKCIAHLIKWYPDYCQVKNLPVSDDEAKIDLCYLLYNQAIILVEQISD